MSYVDSGFDRSILVTMTPDEIKNMMIDFSERFCQARKNGVETPVEELIEAYYNVSMSIFQTNDPTRFICNS